MRPCSSRKQSSGFDKMKYTKKALGKEEGKKKNRKQTQFHHFYIVFKPRNTFSKSKSVEASSFAIFPPRMTSAIKRREKEKEKPYREKGYEVKEPSFVEEYLKGKECT